jgi:hypothetical protein
MKFDISVGTETTNETIETTKQQNRRNKLKILSYVRIWYNQMNNQIYDKLSAGEWVSDFFRLRKACLIT